jgi:hypothetical protein
VKTLLLIVCLFACTRGMAATDSLQKPIRLVDVSLRNVPLKEGERIAQIEMEYGGASMRTVHTPSGWSFEGGEQVSGVETLKMEAAHGVGMLFTAAEFQKFLTLAVYDYGQFDCPLPVKAKLVLHLYDQKAGESERTLDLARESIVLDERKPVARAPELVPEHPTCFELASAANRFIELGENGTIAELTRQWSTIRSDVAEESSTREQIGWICRLVFTPKLGKALRQPYFGGLAWVPFHSIRYSEWPLFPLVESDGVFFLLGEGYVLAGQAEDPLDYLSYCRANGVFRAKIIPIPSEEKAKHALEAFFRTEVWMKLNWEDSFFGAAGTIDFLKAQTKVRARREAMPSQSNKESANQPPSLRPPSAIPAVALPVVPAPAASDR